MKEIDIKIDTCFDGAERSEASDRSEEDKYLQKKIIEHKLKIEDEKISYMWKSGCLLLDRRAVQFFTQITIIVLVMGFSIVQLVRLEDCNSQKTYVGLLTLLIGLVIPNPKFDNRKII